MKKCLVACIFLFVASFHVFSQEEQLSEYSYIVVPKRFDFQFEEDQYQLNSLLKFLFNKHGFHAYFENELPDVRRCDGLWAEVNGKPGFIWNEVTIKIKDCDGLLLFETKTAKSKLKEYGKAYSESLRNAFFDIEVLAVHQKNMETLLAGTSKTDQDTSEPVDEPPVETVTIKLRNPLNLPNEKYSNFTHADKSYLLRKMSNDFRFYEETPGTDDDLTYVGKLFVVDGVLFFENQKEKRFLASFDDQQNLRVNEEGTQILYQKAN